MEIGNEFLFFFSSRRRHTRFDCDWSSDVCSSDLALLLVCCPAIVVNRPGAGADAAAPTSVRLRLSPARSEEHTSELQSQSNLVCRLLLEKKNNQLAVVPRPALTIDHSAATSPSPT